MSKLSNTIMLLRLLQNGRKYSIKELAEKLEVSTRMIREYKNELEQADIYLESIRGPYGGYYLNQSIKLPHNLDKSKPVIINNKENYNLLCNAIAKKNKCYIEYYSKEHNEMTKRIIRPYEMILFDKEWGVAAFCESKQGIRHFNIDRIKKLKILDEKF